MPPESGSFRGKGVKTMANMTKMGQSVLATLAAFVLTATAVGAAVGPATAVDAAPAPVSLVAAQISGQASA
jgi:hypothetical protein